MRIHPPPPTHILNSSIPFGGKSNDQSIPFGGKFNNSSIPFQGESINSSIPFGGESHDSSIPFRGENHKVATAQNIPYRLTLGVPPAGPGVPVAFSDASNDSDPFDGLCQAGYVIQMSGGPVIFQSKKLKHVSPTGSASHCEYMALAQCTQAVVWLRQLRRVLGCDDLITEPTLVFGDNKQANTLVREAIVTSGNQYIYLPYHFNKEAQALGYVDVLSVKTALNVADLFTKPVPAANIRDLMGQMLGYTPIDYAEVLKGFEKTADNVSKQKRKQAKI